MLAYGVGSSELRRIQKIYTASLRKRIVLSHTITFLSISLTANIVKMAVSTSAKDIGQKKDVNVGNLLRESHLAHIDYCSLTVLNSWRSFKHV
jgi:hypothetical protein